MARIRVIATAASFVVALVATFYRVPVTYNVTVKTEVVSAVAAPAAIPRWVLSDVEVQDGCEGTMRPFSGGFKPSAGASIVFERIEKGPLRIRARAERDGPAGQLFDTADEPMRAAGRCIVFRVLRPGDHVARGLSLVFPLTGRAEIGREPRFETSAHVPLLRSGRIKLIGRAILGQRHYDAGMVDLDVGDLFVVERPVGYTVGFVVVDDSAAMTGVFRTLGRGGTVTRFAAEGFEVSASLWARLANDPVLAGVWITLGFLLGVLAKWKW